MHLHGHSLIISCRIFKINCAIEAGRDDLVFVLIKAFILCLTLLHELSCPFLFRIGVRKNEVEKTKKEISVNSKNFKRNKVPPEKYSHRI